MSLLRGAHCLRGGDLGQPKESPHSGGSKKLRTKKKQPKRRRRTRALGCLGYTKRGSSRSWLIAGGQKRPEKQDKMGAVGRSPPWGPLLRPHHGCLLPSFP